MIIIVIVILVQMEIVYFPKVKLILILLVNPIQIVLNYSVQIKTKVYTVKNFYNSLQISIKVIIIL